MRARLQDGIDPALAGNDQLELAIDQRTGIQKAKGHGRSSEITQERKRTRRPRSRGRRLGLLR
jgi:hypothetical protein